MILVIDNYDSFVHNLARYFEQLGVETHVARNDAIDADGVRHLAPQAIILSPGPCTPDEAGCSLELVQQFWETIPLLGVCLGHQVIAKALGGRVVRALEPRHGRASRLAHLGSGVFAGLPASFDVGRYHSLVVEPDTLPAELKPTAWTDDGILMAFAHRQRPVVGLQFHPESILTENGYAILANFLRIAGIETDVELDGLESHEKPAVVVPQRWPDQPVTF